MEWGEVGEVENNSSMCTKQAGNEGLQSWLRDRTLRVSKKESIKKRSQFRPGVGPQGLYFNCASCDFPKVSGSLRSLRGKGATSSGVSGIL